MTLPLLLTLLLQTTSPTPPPTPPPNLYHPGHFDSHLFGGIFSSQLNVTLSPAENHTPSGKSAWQLTPATYQHLELLLAPHAPYRLSFYAKSPAPLELQLKVVVPDGKDPSGKTKTREIITPLPIAASTEWKLYSFDFTTSEPYPGPEITEILLAAYNPLTAPAYLDDLQITPLPSTRPATPTPTSAIPPFSTPSAWHTLSAPTSPLPPSALRDLPTTPPTPPTPALLLASPSPDPLPSLPPSAVFTLLDPAPLAGKRIRLHADITYLTTDLPITPWSAILIVLDLGTNDSTLPSTPSPFWLPINLAAPAGKPKTISATFTLPKDLPSLRLRLLAQPGLAQNHAQISNLRLEILP